MVPGTITKVSTIIPFFALAISGGHRLVLYSSRLSAGFVKNVVRLSHYRSMQKGRLLYIAGRWWEICLDWQLSLAFTEPGPFSHKCWCCGSRSESSKWKNYTHPTRSGSATKLVWQKTSWEINTDFTLFSTFQQLPMLFWNGSYKNGHKLNF